MCPWLQVAHYIKETFLEPEHRQDPLPLRLVLDNPSGELKIDIMPRTNLAFFVLAFHLKTTIAVFSSRAKPRVYDPPGSNGVITLFHVINGPKKISNFEVLRLHKPGSAQQQRTVDCVPSTSLDSVVPFASFRHEDRKQAQRPHKAITDGEKDQCKVQYQIAW